MQDTRKEALESFLVRLGVTMQDLSLMDTALTHSSYAYECKEKVVPEFNQRLEFLGDSVLSLVVSTHLYLAYPEMDEGALSKFRAFLVCEETLAELAQDLAIGDYLLLGRGECHMGGRYNPSILADAFESVMGAYYLDAGYEKVRDLLTRVLIDKIPELTADGIDRDYKTRFQELIQAQGQTDIHYEEAGFDGPPHNRTFFMKVIVGEKTYGTGSGRTKKLAEQRAAREALRLVKKKQG